MKKHFPLEANVLYGHHKELIKLYRTLLLQSNPTQDGISGFYSFSSSISPSEEHTLGGAEVLIHPRLLSCSRDRGSRG